jgi:hypothetical protein
MSGLIFTVDFARCTTSPESSEPVYSKSTPPITVLDLGIASKTALLLAPAYVLASAAWIPTL